METSLDSNDLHSAETHPSKNDDGLGTADEAATKNTSKDLDKPTLPHGIEEGVGAHVTGQKQLGVMDGAKFLVSYVVGAGIFTTVNDVQKNIGNMWVTLGLWISCGLLCLVGALCYAELACMLPGSGGEHIYMHHGYGIVGMRLFDWMSFIMLRPAGNAYYAMKFVFFVCSLFSTSPLSWWQEIAYGSAFIAFITLFSILAPALFDKAQKFFTYTKVLGLISVVISGIAVLIYKTEILLSNADPKNTPQDQRWLQPAQAVCDAILTFDGWNAINPIAGRFKNPTIVIPNAILYGTSFIIFIYLLVIMSYFFIQRDFSSKDASTVFEAIAKELFKNKNIGTYIGNPIICLAIFSATQAGIACSVDSFDSAVADGSLPKWLMKKSAMFGTHHYMLTIQAVFSILYIVVAVGLQMAFTHSPADSSDHASQFAVVPFCIFYVLSVFVIVKEMFKKHKLSNPGYKANRAFPFIFVLATSALILMLLGMNFQKGFKANAPDKSSVYRNVIMLGLFLVCLLVALLTEIPKGKKAKLELDGKQHELEELNATAVIPPKLVESALLGSTSESEQ